MKQHKFTIARGLIQQIFQSSNSGLTEKNNDYRRKRIANNLCGHHLTGWFSYNGEF